MVVAIYAVCYLKYITHKCPDFQVSLYDKAPFGTITKCVDYAGVPIFKCPDFTVYTMANNFYSAVNN